MHMTIPEFESLSRLAWEEKHTPLTIDTTEDPSRGRYRVGLDPISITLTSLF